MNETSLERRHPFCVISKAAWGDPAAHDVQTNSAWSANPYGEEYAVVPDDMVKGILATRGFCDIELNEDGTKVVRFTAREIPDLPAAEAEPTQLDQIEAQVTYTAMMTGTLLEG